MHTRILPGILMIVPVAIFGACSSSPISGDAAGLTSGQPVWRGESTAKVTGTCASSLTLQRPSTAVAGDVLLAAIAMGNTSDTSVPTMTPPSGWNAADQTNHGTITSLWLYWHVVGNSEPSSYTWSLSSCVYGVGWISDYGGVDPVHPINAKAGKDNSSSGTSYSFPTITTTAANTLLVASAAGYANSSTTWTAPSGMTKRADVFNGGNRDGMSADEMHASAGASTVGNAVASVSQSYALTELLALAPAPISGSDGGTSADSGSDASPAQDGSSGSDAGTDAGALTDCQGSGATVYASPTDNIVSKISTLNPGDTLVLNDGVYQNNALSIQNKQGTATKPICIKAAHEGKAIFDSSGATSYQQQPIYVGAGAAYVVIQGVAARNSPWSVVFVGFDAHDVTLRRITAHDAATGNEHVFNISGQSTYGPTSVLVEDCAGWGRGRYVFAAYHANNTTFRRDFAYWEDTENWSPAPRSPFGVYGSKDVTLENVIGMHAVPFKADDNYYTGTFETSDDTVNWPTNNTKVLGSMFFDNLEGWWVNGSAGSNTTFDNCYFQAASTPSSYTTKQQGDGLYWGGPSGSITNCTFVNSTQGLKVESGPPSLTNSVFYKNGRAIDADPGHSYVDFFGNGVLGASLGSTDKTVNPGYDATTFGTGAYLFLPSGSPLKNAGANGRNIGADIRYQYLNGALTTVPLWPWPMEGRIMAERNISVTWASGGGLWNTLSGVY